MLLDSWKEKVENQKENKTEQKRAKIGFLSDTYFMGR